MATFNFDLTSAGKQFERQLEQMKKMEVAVGFQRGEATSEDGTDLVDIAAYNEFGTSTIPARPFLQQSFDNHQDELRQLCEQAYKTVVSGGGVDDALQMIGVGAKGLVQEEIVNGDFAPNAESTIKAKGSAQPLIDTGTMRQSVNFTVRQRSK